MTQPTYSAFTNIMVIRDRRLSPSRAEITAWLDSMGASLPPELQAAPLPLLRGYLRGLRDVLRELLRTPRLTDRSVDRLRVLYLSAFNEAIQHSPQSWAFVEAHADVWGPLWRDEQGHGRGLDSWPEPSGAQRGAVAEREWWEEAPAAWWRAKQAAIEGLAAAARQVHEEAWKRELDSDPATAEQKRRDVRAWMDRRPPSLDD